MSESGHYTPGHYVVGEIKEFKKKSTKNARINVHVISFCASETFEPSNDDYDDGGDDDDDEGDDEGDDDDDDEGDDDDGDDEDDGGDGDDDEGDDDDDDDEDDEGDYVLKLMLSKEMII